MKTLLYLAIFLLPLLSSAQSDLLKGGELILNGISFLKGTDEDIVKEAKQMGFI